MGGIREVRASGGARHLVSLLLACVLAAGTLAAPSAGGAERPADPAASTARPVPAKPKRTEIGPGQDPTRVILKFAEGSNVRLRDGRFVAPDDRGGVAAVNKTISGYEAVAAPMFGGGEEKIARLGRRAEALGRSDLADMNLYFDVALAKGADTARFIDALNGENVVELAYARPIAVPAGHEATPNFTGQQGYTDSAAAGGLDFDYINQFPGGRGQGVRIVDKEGGWNFDHEDLGLPSTTLVNACFNSLCMVAFNSQAPNWNNHGTAVLGVLVAKDNAFGITGVARDAEPQATSADPPHAVYAAVQRFIDDGVAAGVILVEVAYVASDTPNDNVPVEAYLADRDAITFAVASGFTVVEAAGNGGRDLDAYTNSANQHVLRRSYHDSGAIMVGAGCPKAAYQPNDYVGCGELEAIAQSWWGSNYGTRLDVQAWGTGVRTLGYGTPQPGDCDPGELCGFGKDSHADEPDRYYAGAFGGTSSASAIIAGAAAALQGARMQSGWNKTPGQPMSPVTLRNLMISTGVPQPAADAALRRIGPRPNLRAAVDSWSPWLEIELPIEIGCVFQPCDPTPCLNCLMYPGDFVDQLINVMNEGHVAIGGPRFQFDLPAQMAFRSVQAPRGWSCAAPASKLGGAVSCRGPDLGADSGVQIRVQMQLAKSAQRGNFLAGWLSAESADGHLHQNLDRAWQLSEVG